MDKTKKKDTLLDTPIGKFVMDNKALVILIILFILILGTRLCLQSVVCYTLCRRCCENAVATREGKGI